MTWLATKVLQPVTPASCPHRKTKRQSVRDSGSAVLSLCCHPSVKHTALSSSPESGTTQWVILILFEIQPGCLPLLFILLSPMRNYHHAPPKSSLLWLFCDYQQTNFPIFHSRASDKHSALHFTHCKQIFWLWTHCQTFSVCNINSCIVLNCCLVLAGL